MEAVLFFVAAIGALGGAIGVVAMRNPFYGVLALIVHLFSLAVLFLLLTSAFVAAAQVVVYAGAVMVLYVFVVAYVGGGERVGLGADPRPALPGAAARRRALRRALDRRPRLLPAGARHRRPRRQARLRRPRRDRPPAAGKVPAPLRGLLDPAAARRGRRGRPRRRVRRDARVLGHSAKRVEDGPVQSHEHRVVHRPLVACSSPSARSAS